MLDALLVLIALMVGLAIGWSLCKRFTNVQASALRQQLTATETREAENKRRADEVVTELTSVRNALEAERIEHAAAQKRETELRIQLTSLQQTVNTKEAALQERELRLKEVEEKLPKLFESAANKTLLQAQEQFTGESSARLKQLLEPFGEKVTSFQKEFATQNEARIKDTESLKENLRHLVETTKSIQTTSDELTKALTARPQAIGQFGEIILDKVLEVSGISDDLLVARQESHRHTDENGGRSARLDVVVKLPDNRSIVVDAKLNLPSWINYVNANSKEEQQRALNQLTRLVRGRVEELSSKKYTDLPDLKQPDFVVLFLPLEQAYSAVLSADDTLFSYAFERQVILAGPSSLLALLKLIHQIWRQEKIAQNASDIAIRGGKLYDKFVSVIQDVQAVEQHFLLDGRKKVDDLKSRFYTGNGNLIRQVEMLKELGVKTDKQLPKLDD